MKVTNIDGMGSYGVYIDGVDFAHLTDEQWREIGHIHMKSLVTIIRDCNLSCENQLGWIKKFGEPRHGLYYRLMKKYGITSLGLLVRVGLSANSQMDAEDKSVIRECIQYQQSTSEGAGIARVSGSKDAKGRSIGLFNDGELLWHSNEAATLTFTPGVALLGAKCMVGSSTGFLQTADYYASVSESFRSELDEMVVTHRYTEGKINPVLDDNLGRSNMCPVDDTEIPMVIRSPGGIKGLHYPLNTIYGIRGMSKAESDSLFAEINKHLYVDHYIYDHWYKNDKDLLLFDNSITLHRRLGNVPGRLAYRIQHDYSELQDDFWQPYFQKEFADTYKETITDFVETLGLHSFKLPQVS
ncbi:MAG: TauD/TfdA dioxygenase family protein [Candidatus Tectimicrobiota bacterium]